MSKFWDNITPWNTQNERNQNTANKLALEKQQAEINQQIAASKLKQSVEDNKLYIILGLVVVVMVVVVAYFKFRKK